MPMTQLIQNQYDTYASAFDDVMKEHRSAMRCREVEDVVQKGLLAMFAIDMAYRAWVVSISNGYGLPDDASRLASWMDQIIRLRPGTIELIEEVEAEGYDVASADVFRAHVFKPLDERAFDVEFGDDLSRISSVKDPLPSELA